VFGGGETWEWGGDGENGGGLKGGIYYRYMRILEFCENDTMINGMNFCFLHKEKGGWAHVNKRHEVAYSALRNASHLRLLKHKFISDFSLD
jgi:hypothetical protein